VTDNPLPTGPGNDVHIVVRADQPAAPVPRTLLGNNAAVWLDRSFLFHPTFEERLQNAGTAIIRWPGGSIADHFHWDNNVPPTGPAAEWPELHDPVMAPSTGAFLTLAARLDALPIIVVNHGFTSYGGGPADRRLENAVNLAADWVEYCNAEADGSNPRGGVDQAARRAADGFPRSLKVTYWEVGNEVFGPWEVGHTDGATYARHFVAFARAMKEVDPTIRVGANAVVNFDRPGTTTWMAQFLSNQEAVAAADFIDIHDYFTYVHDAGRLPKDREIRGYFLQIHEDREELDRLFARWAGRPVPPIFFGEFHLSHPQNPLNVSLAAGLVTATVLGEMATEGFAAAAFWDSANEWGNGGDLGFVSRSHPAVPDFAPHPAYYAFWLWARNMGDTLVSAETDDFGLRIYAGTFADGPTGVMIVNPTDAPRNARLTVTGTTLDGYVNAFVLTGPAFKGSAFSFNGIATAHGVAGVPPESAVPYTGDAGRDHPLTVHLPAYSLTSLVIY